MYYSWGGYFVLLALVCCDQFGSEDSPVTLPQRTHRSVFGEDALVNLSVERRGETHEEYKIFGYIRIRSKTQGIALSLGDRINNKQRDEETKTNGKS